MVEFDRFEELAQKIEQDGYLKEYYGEYDANVIAQNMVLYAPEEFKQNLYEYIDGDIVVGKDGLWSFGPFTDIRINGVSLNDVMNYYKERVLFRQKYANSWLRCFKRIDDKIKYMSPQTRVIHPVVALRLLKNWKESGYPGETDMTHKHWKSNFVVHNLGHPYEIEGARLENIREATQSHPAVYGKF